LNKALKWRSFVASRIGQQFGNYQLFQLLGKGSFAEVYLGGHIHLGTLAAIKVLHTQSMDVNAFRTEARIIAHLIHPHIVRVLEFGIEDQVPFLVMDFAPYGTLRLRHPKGERIPLPTVVSYARQVADALQYAHDERLVHRDVKPGNMLVGRRNEVLLSDFGIALLAQSSHDQHPYDTAGTMLYMAPEQIRGRPCAASDQYSLGIVVYEWLCGTLPFTGASSIKVAMKQLSEPAQALRDIVPSISPAVEQVVMRALAKDPEERFMSVQGFAAELEQASLSDESSMLTRPSPSIEQSLPPISPAGSPDDTLPPQP
jgi:eukaryotic-like serine/threonine-protein kinase